MTALPSADGLEHFLLCGRVAVEPIKNVDRQSPTLFVGLLGVGGLS